MIYFRIYSFTARHRNRFNLLEIRDGSCVDNRRRVEFIFSKKNFRVWSRVDEIIILFENGELEDLNLN